MYQSANWWRFTLAGGLVLGTLIVTLNITGEVDDSLWLAMIIVMIGSVVTLAAGLLLGLDHLRTRRDAQG
jgi:hypothetical protein